MRALRVVALVLGSALFIPVSCTSALYAGIDVIAYLDAKEVARGDQVHPTFSIVVAPGDKGEPFRSMSLSEFKLLREAGQPYSVLMPAPSGRINVDDGYLSYRVLENQGSVQVIEVEDKIDIDRQTWSRYRATSTDVAPPGVANALFWVPVCRDAARVWRSTAAVRRRALSSQEASRR